MENPGSLILVLQSHLPYGLAEDPMEDWRLYEIAAETYLPLLEMAARLDRGGFQPRFALSFTPVMLDQLACPRFKRGFKNYLATLARAAEEERMLRGRRKETGLSRLQRMWRDYCANALSYFSDGLKEDLPAAFRRAAEAGWFEPMASAATHAYLPLLGLDENVRAQIELGVEACRRHFGIGPRGFWIPECAYRPAGHWWPPVRHERLGDHDRRGVDDLLREAGLDYFFIDQAQLGISPPAHERNSSMRLHRMGPPDDRRRLLGVYTRDFSLSRRAWDLDFGYPSDSLYLGFQSRTERGGFRLWKRGGADGGKPEYDPARAFNQVHRHAADFLGAARDALSSHRQATGEAGVIVAAFDAELFGHRWFEGIAWLEAVARTAAAHGLRLETPAQYFDANPPASHVELRESSSGPNRDHSAWVHEDAKWTWWNIYEAETSIQHLGYLLNGRELSPAQAEVLRLAIRQLLILEASDWAFMIGAGQERGRAERRAASRFGDFKRLAEMLTEIASSGAEPSSEKWNFVRETGARDLIFPALELDLLWRGKFHVREAKAATDASAAGPGAIAPLAS